MPRSEPEMFSPQTCSEEMSEKYKEYIEEHQSKLEEKCEQLNDCIDRVLDEENVLLLLKGGSLSLNKTCVLINDDDLDVSFKPGKCTAKDRKDIREDIEQNLKTNLEDVRMSGWRNVKKCLNNNYGDKERSTHVSEICGLARKQQQICDNHNIHKTVRTFFNNEIHQLKCVCKNLQNDDEGQSSSSLPSIIGGLAGVLLLLFIILLVLCIIIRGRKSLKSKKHAPNVIYLPAPNGDSCPVYQEVFDAKSYGLSHSGSPPTLPMRYSPHPAMATRLAGQEDEPAYLEPATADFRFRPKLPFPGKTNPNYGAPPEYSETDEALNKTDAENGYFQPLPTPPKESGFERAEGNRYMPENQATMYDPVEPLLPAEETPTSGRACQESSKRKTNDQEEPRYHLLERESVRKAIDTTV